MVGLGGGSGDVPGGFTGAFPACDAGLVFRGASGEFGVKTSRSVYSSWQSGSPASASKEIDCSEKDHANSYFHHLLSYLVLTLPMAAPAQPNITNVQNTSYLVSGQPNYGIAPGTIFNVAGTGWPALPRFPVCKIAIVGCPPA